MRPAVLFAVTFAGLTGSVFGFPPGASDPCLNSPCGRGANCQTMTTIAVCTCPGDSKGDPFVDCNVTSGQTQPTQGPESSSASTFTHSISPVPISSNSGIPLYSSIAFSKSPSSSAFSADFQLGTAVNRIPIRGSSTSGQSSDSSSVLNNQMHSTSGSMRVRGQINDDLEPHSNPFLKFPLLSSSRSPQANAYPSQTNTAPDLTLNSFTKDPMGQYSNCRTVNNIIVCADNSVDDTLPGTTSHQSGSDNRFQEHIVSQFSKQNPSNPHRTGAQSNDHHIHIQNVFSLRPITQNTQNPQAVQPPQRGNVNSNLQKTGSDDSICKSSCGIGSVCRLILGRPVCGCPEGHTGDPSINCEAIVEDKLKSGCERHIDCTSTEICLESKCVDPCSNSSVNEPPVFNINSQAVKRDFCGRNAKCVVIEHTPLCGCMDGFYGNPYLACVA